MSTTNERATERAGKAERRERPADLYDPHFAQKRRVLRPDQIAAFDPHFPARRRA